MSVGRFKLNYWWCKRRHLVSYEIFGTLKQFIQQLSKQLTLLGVRGVLLNVGVVAKSCK